MPTSTYVLASVPISIVTITLVLKHGPSAVLTLFAGVVAVLASDRRGERALAVLRLVRAMPAATRARNRRATSSGRS